MWHRSLQRDAIAMVPCSSSGRTGSAPAGPRPGLAPAGRRPEPGPVGGRADSLAVLAPAEPRLADDIARATGAEHDPRRDGQPPNAIAYAPASAYAGAGGPPGRERGSRSATSRPPSGPPPSSPVPAGADVRPRRADRSPDRGARLPSDLGVGISRRWAVGPERGRWLVRGPPARTSPAATGL